MLTRRIFAGHRSAAASHVLGCMSPAIVIGRRFCLSIVVPSFGDSIKTGKVVGIVKNVGDTVSEDETIMSVESDKATVTLPAPKSGTITAILVKDGDVVNVGQDVAKVKEGAVVAKPTAAAPASPAAAAPPAAKVAAEAPRPAPAASAPTTVVSGKDPRVRLEKITTLRNRIAERLKSSQNTAAMLTTFNEIDLSNVMKARDKYKDEFLKKHDVRLGFMSMFAKASAQALMEVPIVNASWGTDVIEYHDYVDISVAVSTPKGLVVPVLRDVHRMSLADIEKAIEDFGKRAKENKLTIPEMTGGTFTISNGGTFGSWMGTPIINPPQSAILGMHAIKKKPWVDEKDQIVVRNIMAVALTYDHRLIDGRDAVTFLVKVKGYLEDPLRMLLDL
mgnify:FL=1